VSKCMGTVGHYCACGVGGSFLLTCLLLPVYAPTRTMHTHQTRAHTHATHDTRTHKQTDTHKHTHARTHTRARAHTNTHTHRHSFSPLSFPPSLHPSLPHSPPHPLSLSLPLSSSHRTTHIDHFPPKSLIMSGSFAGNDLQFEASDGVLPPCNQTVTTEVYLSHTYT